MSKIRFGLFARNLVVAFLLSGMAVGLAACPTTEASYMMRDGADNHGSSDSSGGSRY